MPDSSLVARRLREERRVVCGSPAYFARRGHPRTPAELAGHDCVIYSLREQRWWFSGVDGDAAISVTGTVTTNDAHAQLTAAIAGVGLAWLPSYLAEPALAAGQLETTLDAYSYSRRSVYLLYHHRDNLPLKVRVFVAFLVEKLAAERQS
jgi:DNA-binding transcriptional LysR family regulator